MPYLIAALVAGFLAAGLFGDENTEGNETKTSKAPPKKSKKSEDEE